MADPQFRRDFLVRRFRVCARVARAGAATLRPILRVSCSSNCFSSSSLAAKSFSRAWASSNSVATSARRLSRVRSSSVRESSMAVNAATLSRASVNSLAIWLKFAWSLADAARSWSSCSRAVPNHRACAQAERARRRGAIDTRKVRRAIRRVGPPAVPAPRAIGGTCRESPRNPIGRYRSTSACLAYDLPEQCPRRTVCAAGAQE